MPCSWLQNRNTCMTSQLFFFTNLSCLLCPCSTPNSKAGNTGHRSRSDSPTGALTGLHLKMTAPFYVIYWINFTKAKACTQVIYTAKCTYLLRVTPAPSLLKIHYKYNLWSSLWIVHEWWTTSNGQSTIFVCTTSELTWLWLDCWHSSIMAALQMTALQYYQNPLAKGLQHKQQTLFKFHVLDNSYR